MVVPHQSAWLRFAIPIILSLTLAALLACNPATPTDDAAAPADTVAAPASSDATVAPAAPQAPAEAVSDTMLHLAVTPLPQEPSTPGWLPAADTWYSAPCGRT